jgi:hypothetical protein
MSLAKKVKGVSIALKAKASKAIEKEESEDKGNGSESNEELALFVKKFNKFMRKKKGQPRRSQTSRRNAFNDRKCFECGEPGHIAMNCSSKKNKGKDGDDKKKKFYHKKKDVKSYLVEWDSNASLDDDDDSSSKLNARIAIKEAPSLFSSPHCLMAKCDAKVKIIIDLNDVDDDDVDLDLDDDDGYTYDDQVRMLGEADDYMHKEKEKFRTLKELYKNLQVSFEELKTSHNNLKESCENLVEAQSSSLVHEVVVVTETEPPKSLDPPTVVLVQRTSDNPTGALDHLTSSVSEFLTLPKNVSPFTQTLQYIGGKKMQKQLQ